MRRLILFSAMLAVAAVCFGPATARATVAGESAPATNAVVPGKELAHAVSEITGVAISPLLGASAIGAWQYYQARTPQQRARLPWFAQPWFWIPAFVLVLACFLKDTLGITAPRLLKKPLDVADTIAHKVSGLIATGAFVPIVMSVLPPAPQPEASLYGANGFLAIINLSWLGNGLLIALGMFAFFIVFLASNAINILILLSPFGLVDAALKGFRLLLLSTVALTAFVSPWLGCLWALLIIVVAYFIAGWSFRLSHFGVVFLWDFLTRRCARFTPTEGGNRMFLACKVNKVPARSYGMLRRETSGRFVLKYRPWLILPERVLTLPASDYAVGKGLFYSQLMCVDGDNLSPLILLPPRYRGHEERVVEIYKLLGVRDTGLRAAIRWFKGLLGFKLQPA